MGKLASEMLPPTQMAIDACRRPDCRVIEPIWPWRLQMESDERAIRELHTVWIDAVNAGDLGRLLTLMADDVVLLHPGRAPFGREGFSDGFLAAHQQSRIRCISELEEVVIAGGVAYTLCRDTLSVTPRAGGEATELAGHRITIYRKQPDGRWLLARDANTLSPVAQPSHST
jgi:uncharacterized protein (TIGR02246 family)